MIARSSGSSRLKLSRSLESYVANILFEWEQFSKLPLWAQVLMASRLVRRALNVAPPGEKRAVAVLTAGCDALDAAARLGQLPSDRKMELRKAGSFQPTADMHGPAAAMYYAIDSAKAAEASQDFSAAEAACSSSVAKAFDCITQAKGLTAVQVQIWFAADLDSLQFACAESRVGRYDAIPESVIGRLVPVN